MAIRRLRKSSLRKAKARRDLFAKTERKPSRDLQLEHLEDRRLMAGAQLIGIQPNTGALLQDGDILNIAPTDLTFRFDKNQTIDPTSLGDSQTIEGIQITRANFDGTFTPAAVSSDFNTGGAVRIEFSAVRLGSDQNGITLAITKSDFGGPGLPGVSVIDRTISINLNVNAGNQTTAADLLSALANSADASNLIMARITGGTSLTPKSVNIAATASANTSLTLSGANDEVIHPGYIGVAAAPALNEVIYRFAGSLPDDTYRIDVFGTGATPLRSIAANNTLVPFQDGADTSRQFELDLAPQVVAVVPQPVTRLSDGTFRQDRDKIVVYFNNDDLNLTTAQDQRYYALIFTNDTLENVARTGQAEDVVFNPTSVVYEPAKDLAVLTFAEPLDQLDNVYKGGAPVGAGTFRLRIGNNEIPATVSATDPAVPAAPVVITPTVEATSSFNGAAVRFLGLGEQWGQAVRIQLTESNHGDDSAPTVEVVDHVIRVDLNTNALAGNVHSPSTAQELVAAINNHFNAGKLVQASVDPAVATTPITGTTSAEVVLTGMGSSFATATNLNTVTAQNLIVRGSIEPQVFKLDLPGSNDEPGHREVTADQPTLENHVPDDSSNRPFGQGAKEMGVTRLEYNFRQDIGTLPDQQGSPQPAFNTITEAQKRLAREIFQILSDRCGIEFVETEKDGVIIASGDTNTTNRNQDLIVIPLNLNDRFNYGSATPLGSGATNANVGWFRTMFNRVGSYLGLGETWELPGPAILGWDTTLNIAGQALEPTILSDNDVVHLRQIYVPESKDIDLYRFTLTGTGNFSVESFAERLGQSSLLDTELTLWQENADGTRQLLSRNDDYFSGDSYISVDLGPGVYYVGVAASGNGDYDPTIEDTGFGGTTQGDYELRFNFRPDVYNGIIDADNPTLTATSLDGDGDGVPGGVYNFWFRAQTPGNVLFVDKAAAAGGTGTAAAPYNNLATALSAAQPGQIVRVEGNPGQDGDLGTVTDNRAYQIGFNSLGSPLPDGSTMEVPKGVTVMIDAGAVFQLLRARIGVGSSAISIDRSQGALQVLGAPLLLNDANGDGSVQATDAMVVDAATGQAAAGSVYFTSYNDQQIGLDTNPFLTTPKSGDWGGILFRDDVDRAQGNFVYDEEGIFLNYVNHADMRYGGGTVLVNSVQTVINPIHMVDTRPTVTFNTIQYSADAALSATPDSFEETNFHAPRHQRIAFTSDYDRVGPEVHGNTLVQNSYNALFVRVSTPAGSTVQELNVSARWDDTDVVHVLAENLNVASQPGGRIEKVTAPPVNLVTQTAVKSSTAGGGTLGTAGSGTLYSYKLTYVDRFGYESPVSNALTTFQLSAADVAAGRRAIRFAQLPAAAEGYVARRLYRSENNGPYILVAQLNQRDTAFTDDGTTRGGVLQVPPVQGVTLTPQLGGTLLPGTYSYRVTFVDARGHESLPSDATVKLTVNGNPTVAGQPGEGTIRLDNLPQPDSSGNFVARRIYRSSNTGSGTYTLVQEIDTAATAFVDDGGADPTAVLDLALVVPRLSARLSIDPSVVLKLDGARFELELGAQMIVEGAAGRDIVFTSIADDRFGAGGTFDTGNDGLPVAGTSNTPQAGNWGGIYAGPLSQLSVDHALFAYGGGVTRVQGTFTAFNVVEIQEQSKARIANSVFEFNARGQGGQGEADRFGRGFNTPAVVFVRQAQPVIYHNVFRNNPDESTSNNLTNAARAVPAISINVNALNATLRRDTGRTTGALDRVEGYRDNQGPLILDNQMDNCEINGMVVRGQTLDTESVWDDTDIVHVLLSTVRVPDFHTYGGLLLASSPTESLVVKLLNNPSSGQPAGFEAIGMPHEIDDRIGGIIQIVGQPGSPVVLTSLHDDTRGAGTKPNGDPQTDTNSNGSATAPAAGNWNSIRLDTYSHDRNVEIGYEFESRDVNSPGTNADTKTAQVLGTLAPSEYAGDENRRLGFTVKGFLNDAQDLDVYSFEAIPGTEVWIDIDRTTQALDAVLEVLDGDGHIVARSDNSSRELEDADNYREPDDRQAPHLSARQLADPRLLVGEARLMVKTPELPLADLYTINPRDPAMRVVLPGIPDPQNPDKTQTYHVRVRSSSPDLSVLSGGLTSGAYQLQLRLREVDEIGGSTVRYSLIAYAANGIEIYGQPTHSPLTGEVAESAADNNASTGAQGIGNLLQSDRNVISVAGALSNANDVDFYQMDLGYADPTLGTAALFQTTFDIDYANGLGDRPDTSLYVFDSAGRLILTSRDSNIAEDRPSEPGTSSLDDLSRGSAGATDPFIGVTDLRAGRYYYVAVASDRQLPNQLDQFTSATATNPDLRLEPIDSVQRIAEDHLEPLNPLSTNDVPQISTLFDDDSIVPYTLGDVTLYVTTSATGSRQTDLYTVDPFTGAQETDEGWMLYETGDIAIHENGWLYTYEQYDAGTLCQPRDSTAGNFLRIIPGNNEPGLPLNVTNLRDDGIQTYRIDPTDPTASAPSHYCTQEDDWVGDGILFNAVTINDLSGGNRDDVSSEIFAVGDRGAVTPPNAIAIPGVEITNNILYHMEGRQWSAAFGTATSTPNSDRVDDDAIPERLYQGAGTDIRERGELLTSPRLEAVNATIPVANPAVMASVSRLRDGDTFTVADGANQITFELDTGPEVAQNLDVASDQTIRDGNFFILDGQDIFQFDTGQSFLFTGTPSDNGIVTVTATVNNVTRFRTYEFDLLPNPQGAPATTGNVVIAISGALMPSAYAGALANAINTDATWAGQVTAAAASSGTRVSISGTNVTLSYQVGMAGIQLEGSNGRAPILQAVEGSQIADGDNFVIRNNGLSQTFEFDSGYTLTIPVRYNLTVPAAGGYGITNGENFTVTWTDPSSGAITTVTFQLDLGGTTSVVSPTLVSIGYKATDSAATVAQNIWTALFSPALDGIANPAAGLHLAPSRSGSVVYLGSTTDNNLIATLAPSLTAAGVAGGVTDEPTSPSFPLTFTITAVTTTGTTSRTFEFDSGDGVFVDVNGDLTPDNVLIPFSQSDTDDAIAARMAGIVGGAGLLLTPTVLGQGAVNIGGDDGLPAGSPRHTLVVPAASQNILQLSGRPGVDQNVLPRPIAVPYTNSSAFTATAVAQAIETAINNAQTNALYSGTITAYAGSAYADGMVLPGVYENGQLLPLMFDNVRVAGAPAGSAGYTLIPFDPGDPPGTQNPAPATTAAVMAQRIAAAIGTAGPSLFVQSSGDKVVWQMYPIALTTQLVAADGQLVVNGNGVAFQAGTRNSRVSDLTQSSYGFSLIGNIEEVYSATAANGRNLTDDRIAARVGAVVGNHPNYIMPDGTAGAGGAYSRITFPGAASGNFNGVSYGGTRLWIPVTTSGPGVSLGNQSISLLGGDQAAGVASKIAAAINSAYQGASNPLTATANAAYVRLSRGTVIIAPGVQLQVQGSGPGGKVTGIATVGGRMYVVSDQGGLYRVNIAADFSTPATATYIATSANDLLGIQFSGLAAGPEHVEATGNNQPGPYADMLFATDATGNLYAFDTAGVLQPVFADGAKSVSTGLTNVTGLVFSTLDENLFHYTDPYPHLISANSMDVRLGLAAREGLPIWFDERQNDSGHEDIPWSTSLHFGQGNSNGAARSYDFAGGAYGTVVSNAFSLKGYSAADRPTLYFSYYLDTEGDASSAFYNRITEVMRDALRVYVCDNAGDDSGDWQLLTTNDPNLESGIVASPFAIQQTFDVSDWRQVRVDLGPYAGRENLRLRIDFATGGNMGLGDLDLSGFELRTISGSELRDGDTIMIDSRTLEFDSGLTLVVPTGAAIPTAPAGEQITITDGAGNSATLQFVSSVLTTSNIVATDGSQLNDGDTFQISDGTTTKTFELDHGYMIAVPANGGADLVDQATFTVDLDGSGTNLPLTFEFDKYGNYVDADADGMADNTVINIADNLTLVVPAGGGAVVNDQERFILRRVTATGTTSYTFEFDKNGGLTSPANRPINVIEDLTLRLPAAGGGYGGVQDGDYFTIDPDGPTGLQAPIVFQFIKEGSALSPFGVVISFNDFTTQDDLANRVVAAIQSQAGAVKVTAKNDGGGVVVLDGTTNAHRLSSSNPTVTQTGSRPLTQLEVAERIVAALDGVDGVDGTVLGLTLPNVAAGEVVNGYIVLGGTTPAHQLNTSASFSVTQTWTARSANEVANLMATAINQAVQAQFFGSTLRAVGLAGGRVHVFDLAGGVAHVVDVSGAAPGLTLVGRPDVAAGNVPVPFLPTDTVQQIINGGAPEVVGAAPRPGLISVINGAGMNITASQAAYPNEEVIVLAGTAGNTVSFSAGVTALAPQDVIPLYVDGTQTANEVAGRIAQGVRQAVARGLLVGVTPHLNGDLGYEEPSINPGAVRTNRVNLEGATQIVLGLGAASPFQRDGAVGVNDPAAAYTTAVVPFHADMTRVEVADSLKQTLESLYHNPTIVTDNGSRFADGTTFTLDDGINQPAVFEFDSGYVLQIPLGGGNVANGGVEDGDTFRITDPSGTRTEVFEFDKNGSLLLPGNRRITIAESSSALSVAKATVAALNASPLRTTLGLTPRLLSGNRVQIGGATNTTLAISPGSTVTQLAGTPGVTPEQTLLLPPTLGMQLPDPLTIHVPAGGFVDGETFTLDDGILPTVTFELENLNFSNGVTAGNVAVGYHATDTAQDIARTLAAAINDSGLNAQATMLGGTGNIDLGCSPSFTLSVGTGRVLETGPWALQAPVNGGADITEGDQFTITNNTTGVVYTYEFENNAVRDGVTFGAIPVYYLPAESQAAIGTRLLTALRATPGLSPEVTTGDVRVNLGAAAQLALDTSQTHLSQTGLPGGIQDGDWFVIRDGSQVPARTVTFEIDLDGTRTPGRTVIDVAPGSTSRQIAEEIVTEISAAGLGLIPAYLGAGEIHVGGTASHALSVVAAAGPLGITRFGTPGPLADGEVFFVSELGSSVRFEYDKDGSWTPGSTRIAFTDLESTDVIAARTVAAMSSASSGLNIFPKYLGDGEIDLGGDDRHALTAGTNLDLPATPPTAPATWQLTVPAAGGGVGGVVDGETLTIRTPGTDYVFEFDSNSSWVAGHYAVPFTFTATQDAVARSLVAAVGQVAGLGLTPQYPGNGVVDLNATAATHTVVLPSTSLSTTGTPGLMSPHQPVRFAPSDDFTAADVATAIARSINSTLGLAITASVGGSGTADQRRVTLTARNNGVSSRINFTRDALGVLQEEALTTSTVKGQEDMVRIIGHRVTDPGPLGFDDVEPENPITANLVMWGEDTYLAGDAFGGFLSPARSLNNIYEGVYLDDFIIGFAERGEQVNNAQDAQANGTAFATNQAGAFSDGEYQLEIRRGAGYTSPLITATSRRSVNTNDRQAEGTTLVVKRGRDTASGQVFTISDGVKHVDFEYLDTTIAGAAVLAGRIAVPFSPNDTDYAIAQRVRDLINGPDVQAVLDVTASLADGTIEGAGSPAASTNASVNLFGPVTLQVHATTVAESNDAVADATLTGISSVDSPSYIASGRIGDNANFPLRSGLDVDLFRVALASGETLYIDIDASKIGSELDPYLRVFDATGNELAANNSDVAPGELPRLDPYLEFTAPASGVYYLGISGVDGTTPTTADDNTEYDPFVPGSGRDSGTTGFYEIKLTFGAITGTDMMLYHDLGDANHFRDQGQILIQGNTIVQSGGWGIDVQAGNRDGQASDIPHPGPVRNLPKLNTERLAPGVVIMNNVIAGGTTDPGTVDDVVNATWTVTPPAPSNLTVRTVGSEAQVRWGNANADNGSGLGFLSAIPPAVSLTIGQAFALGQVTHYNQTSESTTVTVSAALQASLSLSSFGLAPFTIPFDVQEVANANDILTFGGTGTVSLGGGMTLQLLGFLQNNQLVSQISTAESSNSSATIMVRLLGGGNGIHLSGESQTNASVPFARVVNNTIAGPMSTGIRVENYASPTILNNILADLETGIWSDLATASPVVGGNLYQDNDTNTLGVRMEDFAIRLQPADPLFRDTSTGSYYLAPLTPAIDSSVGSLLERFDFKQVKNTVGIAESPILAPETDVTGQLRVDDPSIESPAGYGQNVFIDRGAVDRSDFVGPTVAAVSPRDNDADGVDANAAPGVVVIDGTAALASFQIRLLDGVPPADPNLGSGVDDTTVTTDNVVVTRDGVVLVDGIDYSFSYNRTSDTVFITPLSGIWASDHLYQVRINNADVFLITPKDGAELADSASFLIQDTDGESATFEFESGYTLVVPQTLQLKVPAAGGGLGGVGDGEIFTISRLVGSVLQKAVFEFDNNNLWADNNRDSVPDNYVISFSVASTADDIAAGIVAAINRANSLMSLGVAPRALGDGLVHLGSTAEHLVDITRARSLTSSGQSGSVRDGDSFVIDDGTRLTTFEFDSNSALIDANGDGQADNPGARLIAFSPAQTNDEIAASVAQAVNVAAVGLDAAAIGSGQVQLGGTANVHFITLNTANLTLLGEPGVRSAWGLQIPSTAGAPRFADDGSGRYLADGDTFTIGDGTRLITFELDDLDDPLGGGITTSPNIRISFHETATLDQLAAIIVAAIQSAPLANLKPVNAGHGLVLLGEPSGTPSNYTLDVTRSGLRQAGLPGVSAAIPVVISPAPEFDDAQVAVRTIAAINGSGLTARAVPDGGAAVVVYDAAAVSEISSVFAHNQQLLGVKDLAGNLLKSNLLTGDTKMTLVLGTAVTDFGDAPQTTGGSYPTTLSEDGAVHVISSTLCLGTRVDSEADGQVSAAVADDVDGAGFTASTAGTPLMSQARPDGSANPSGLLPTVLQLPAPLTLQVGDGAAITDGLTQFRVTNGGVTVTFEFDNTDLNNGLTNTQNVRVPFTPAHSIDEIADTVVAVINSRAADLKLAPVNLGQGRVHVGGDGLTTTGTLAVSGAAHPIQDGNTFSITRPGSGGVITSTFEFEDTEQNNGVGAGHIPVPFSNGTTQDGYAQAVITAILRTSVGIGATHTGTGLVELDGNDDDGVTIKAFNPQTVTQVVVTASGPDLIDPATEEPLPWIGLLDAWIDFNGDGDFSDAKEQIFASQQLVRGANAFEVPPAPDTRFGTTIGRFRISSTGGLKPTGLAADGEVEDYAIQIVAGNPPQARDDAFVTSEDGVFAPTTSVLANDTVDAGDPAKLAQLHVANYQATTELGALVVMDMSTDLLTRGTFTYDATGAAVIQALDAGQTLTDTFTYRAMDSLFLSLPATVTISVAGVNDNPVAVTDVDWSTNQNTAIEIPVLANDSDPEGQALMVTDVQLAGALGQVTIDATGTSVRYNPNGMFSALGPNDSATDRFTYTVSDGKGGSATGTVIVTITGLNDPPVARLDAVNPPSTTPPTPACPSAQTTEDTTAPAVRVLDNDDDPEGGPITVIAVQLGGTKGVAMVNSQGTPGNTVTYNPNGKFEWLGAGQTAADVFGYIVQDAQGLRSSGTVTMTINGVNDQPTAYGDTASVARNATVVIPVLTNDKDPDTGDLLQVSAVGQPSTSGTEATPTAGGTAVLYNPKGRFDYLKIGQTATDRFTYTITDGHGGTSTATVTVTIFGASNPPVAFNDTAATTEDESVDIGVLGNDTDDFNQKQVVSVDTTNLKGTVTINPPGQWNNTVIYSPNGRFDKLQVGDTTTETFSYTVSDGTSTATAAVVVTIRGVNDAPIARVDANSYTVQRGKKLQANDPTGLVTPGVPGDDGVLLNDTDADDAVSTLRAQLVTKPAHAASFTLNSNGTFEYQNDGTVWTSDTFSYRAVDPHGAASAQTVTVVLSIVNAAPADWQNPIIITDVNNDGATSPIDALLLINYINGHPGDLALTEPHQPGDYYFDVNGDGYVTAADVVHVINSINEQNKATGEGEASSVRAAAGATPAVAETGLPALPAPLSPVTAPAAVPAATVPATASETAAKSSAATVTIDRFRIDEILSDIAADVHKAQPERSPLDDVLDELLA